APERAPPPPRRRLTGRQLHALETLPARMEALQGEIAQLRTALGDATLFARDRARFDRFTAALAEREAALSAAEEEWLELELAREAAEGGAA
ncbi:MAG TPA: ABC transporter ATP-binding protein, partial [Crenalkalicoccus sp.]|nr:ABC transporter ATP-binding protein [Crenalkalicoccus sp.]